jgi:3-hydroxyacyl-[acyl-carrier-protein] dehydratase
MAQTAGILLNRIAGNPDGVPFFMGIDGARFRKVVKPGDQLRIEVEITKLRSKLARFKARALVDGKVASEAEMMCMIGAQDGPK